jgi:methylated-DNA-[protein]-cysteine S-methyltransferase
MSRYYDQFDTPLGQVTAVVNDLGELLEFGFGSWKVQGESNPAKLFDVRTQVDEYFARKRTDFSLPLADQGTEFQRSVWKLLQQIPYGETTSYGALARKLAMPGASRAVGRANATNPIALIVPCHRVIGTSGRLTGYAGGLGIKSRLLEFEHGGLFA